MNSLKDIEREYKEANTTRWLAAEKECGSVPSAGLWALRIATHHCFCPCPPEERLALASSRVDDGKRRIEEARQMIVEGKNMRNNGAREAKRHQKELNRVTSEHEKEINRLSRKLKSDERSARAEARQAITSQRNNFREESREVKANLRAAIREQKKGERLIVRGKRKLETAKQFLSRAQDKERDLIKANHEREKRMAERERKRG